MINKFLKLNIRWILLLGLILTIGLAFFSSHEVTGQNSVIGKKAPDWTLKNAKDENISFSQYKGKVVIVDFWTTWCPPCRKEIPGFIELQRQYADKGLVILGISLDKSAATAKEFARKNGINYPIVHGNAKVAGLYGNIQSIPTTFIVSPAGKIVNRLVGYHTKEVFEAEIKPLLKQVRTLKK